MDSFKNAATLIFVPVNFFHSKIRYDNEEETKLLKSRSKYDVFNVLSEIKLKQASLAASRKQTFSSEITLKTA